MPVQMQTTAQGGAGGDVIQYAFGANANLYSDVLSVPPNAPQPDIQSAFFDRRYELYEVLSKEENALTPTERHFAERRMDAIVAAYRILSNPSTRAEYDEVLATGGTGSGGFSTPTSSPKKKGKANGEGGGGDSSKSRSMSTPSPTKRSRSRSLLRKAFNASPLNRNKSMTDLPKDGSGGSGRRRTSSGLDDGELRLQQQLLQQSNGQVPTQQLNPSSRLSSHLSSHNDAAPPPPPSDDNQTISTIGMRGATTPQRPIRPVGILKNQNSDETDRTRPVESDNDAEEEEEYDFFKAYATQDQDGEDVRGSPIQQRRRHHQHRRRGEDPRRSSKSGSRRSSRRNRYESEEDETTVVEDDETFMVKTLGCSALAPLDFLLRPGKVFRACREEVTGAFDDTTSAFDQVCNVFTLRGSDISAVVGEIDGAKNELSPDKKKKWSNGTKTKGRTASRDKSKSRERRSLSRR